MRRISLRLAVITLSLTAIGGIAASPANAGVVGIYPSSASCEAFGQRGLGTVWPWYTCYQSGTGWALWAPGF
ncbi:hypothetical protein Aple_096470 [Acrocarpospora pleiomorpha]|uniref:Chitin-binding type-3 domain-containing protein n=1 Tax=Acrocarpospora pleiomorpha TaxID=90975 RepID=A0A5M3Y5Z7_9ACTN|nr:hypothetical protein [Acrocarpospora pleiomorpha]GES26748.1 hypothetical protein Aple_096470 [Acrocarpospora pleiomorpha]